MFCGLELVFLAASPDEEREEGGDQSQCGRSVVSFHKLKILMVNELKD
jgi:hypothetical protein